MARSIMHAIAFDMTYTTRGWKPHFSAAIDGRRVCIIGPALASNTAAIERQWRERLIDQAKRLHDGVRNDLVLNHRDGCDGTTFYRCPATI